MLEAIKPLLDSDLVNEDTKREIQEAWDAKLGEVRSQVTAELREEFARRYEHDKSTMVEALDSMVTEALTEEMAQIAEEKKALAEDRAKFVARMKESSGNFEKFMVKQLANEIRELNEDREAQASTISKLEEFIVSQLAEEISEFQQDRQDVVETKVRLVKEARTKFAALKKDFVENASKVLEENVTKYLTKEMSQLKEDIEVAKQNTFGRKLFEAFAAEFSNSYLNENQEIKGLKSQIEKINKQLDEAKVKIAESNRLVESKEKEVKIVKESARRKETLNQLLRPLNKEKAQIMSDLLESVNTDKLESAYNRYLPSVLDGAVQPRREQAATKQLNESRKEVTGDKKAKTPAREEKSVDESNILDLRKLAGLK